jgi:hypothetical protein
MDLQRIAALPPELSPKQEKVIRLYFGLGCQRSHSAAEVAQAFGVSAQAIAGLLGAAKRRLAQDGLTARQLREAARREANLCNSSSPLPTAGSKVSGAAASSEDTAIRAGISFETLLSIRLSPLHISPASSIGGPKRPSSCRKTEFYEFQ